MIELLCFQALFSFLENESHSKDLKDDDRGKGDCNGGGVFD